MFLGYGAVNWSVGVKELNKLVSTERKKLEMVCGVTQRDRIRSPEVAERVDAESIEGWFRRQHWRWFWHVLRGCKVCKDTEVGRVLTMEVVGARGKGRPAR